MLQALSRDSAPDGSSGPHTPHTARALRPRFPPPHSKFPDRRQHTGGVPRRIDGALAQTMHGVRDGARWRSNSLSSLAQGISSLPEPSQVMLRGRLAWRGLAAACRRPHTSQRASGINNSAFTPTHRCFSIDGQAARTLLTDKGHVGLSADQIRISSPAGAFPPSSPSFPPPLAFVLHADRRPQMLPNGKTHFGPSLLVCRSDALPAVSSDDKKLGHGDLGMLRLQMESPSSVAQVPIFVGQGGGLSEADARAAIAAVDPEGDKSPRGAAAILLSQLWKIFEECEGIWFSGMITGSGKDAPAVVSQPFLSFDPFALHRVQSPTLQHLYSTRERDKVTARAEDGGLFYINLGTQGDIGSFGYGAGNAMGTMDGLSNAGGKVSAGGGEGGGEDGDGWRRMDLQVRGEGVCTVKKGNCLGGEECKLLGR